jgi:hypothetical protein
MGRTTIIAMILITAVPAPCSHRGCRRILALLIFSGLPSSYSSVLGRYKQATSHIVGISGERCHGHPGSRINSLNGIRQQRSNVSRGLSCRRGDGMQCRLKQASEGIIFSDNNGHNRCNSHDQLVKDRKSSREHLVLGLCLTRAKPDVIRL